jgi:hypothetical protein
LPRGDASRSPADAVLTPAKAMTAASNNVLFMVLSSLLLVCAACAALDHDPITPHSRKPLSDIRACECEMNANRSGKSAARLEQLPRTQRTVRFRQKGLRGTDALARIKGNETKYESHPHRHSNLAGERIRRSDRRDDAAGSKRKEIP